MDMDDFIKKSFEQGDFAMKEAYWQSASTMLDRHFRRRLWIRRLLAISALAGVAGLIWLATIYFTTPAEIDHAAQLSMTSSNDGANIKTPLEEQSLMNQEITKTTSTLNTSDLAQEATDVSNKSKEYFSAKSVKSVDSYLGKNRFDGVVNKAKFVTSSVENANMETMLGMDANLNDKNVSAQIPNSSFSEVLSSESSEIQNKFLSEEELSNANELAILPLPTLMVSPNSNGLLTLPDIRKPISRPPFRPYWESLIFTQVLAYPGVSQTSKKILGGQLGIEGRYSFSRHWFVRMALAGGVRLGSFDPSIYSTQKSFFLGPQDNAYVTRPSSLWYLGVPLQLGFRNGKNAFLAGVTPQYLLGVYGSLEYARENIRTGDMSFDYQKLDNGWISREGIRSLVLTYTLGYTRQVQDRLHMGLSLQMIPIDWISDTYGRKYEFAAPGYESITTSQKGLVEKNWLLSFNIHYSIK
jgi:hypothetical protein